MEHPYGARRRRLVEQLDKLKLPALAVSHLPNVRYLTGFSGSNALLLVTPGDSILFTDPRYDLQAQDECDCKVQVLQGPLWKALAKVASRRRIRALGLESEKVPHAEWRRLGAQARSLRGYEKAGPPLPEGRGSETNSFRSSMLQSRARQQAAVRPMLSHVLKLRAVDGIVEQMRAVKDPSEVDAIRRSVEVCDRAFARALKTIRPGQREREVAAEIDFEMRRLGAEGPAFETIVAAGARSALPHARPGAQALAANQLLLIDMGASLEGYASDMTRVVHLGKPGRTAKRMYQAVLEAQLAALEAVRPGIPAMMVDQAARKALRGHGLDAHFTHSTGHGLGLEIHEGPRIGKKMEILIEAGMVITIEPGVYLEGEGGVRIEDTVLVTPAGSQVLTRTSKELTVL